MDDGIVLYLAATGQHLFQNCTALLRLPSSVLNLSKYSVVPPMNAHVIAFNDMRGVLHLAKKVKWNLTAMQRL